MNGFLWAMGAATVAFAAGLSYAVTRRYGWGAAVVLPVVALAAVIGMSWQEQGLGLADGIGLIQGSLAFAAPVLLGALVGIVAARLRG
jgi:hypothetical protein